MPSKPGFTRNVLTIARTDPATAATQVVSEFTVQGEQTSVPQLYQVHSTQNATEYLAAVSQNFRGWITAGPAITVLALQPDRTRIQLLDVRDPANVSQAWELELFDVRDILRPRSIASHVLGRRGSFSEATSDPHALTVYSRAAETACASRCRSTCSPGRDQTFPAHSTGPTRARTCSRSRGWTAVRRSSTSRASSRPRRRMGPTDFGSATRHAEARSDARRL
ncbi:MAG: beta-propeller domain-containing protein, partial [Steroidobacteraceae bacterium]